MQIYETRYSLIIVTGSPSFRESLYMTHDLKSMKKVVDWLLTANLVYGAPSTFFWDERSGILFYSLRFDMSKCFILIYLG
jgi:hypothetical protein